MVSTKQVAHVQTRVEFTCVTNSTQDTYQGKVINVRSALRLAFVLGIRFGLKQPSVAGDFMGKWCADHTLDCDARELGERHERALQACIFPLTFTPEAYERMEGSEDE
jgi:hypothetical protein